jgi:hypothetical protein
LTLIILFVANVEILKKNKILNKFLEQNFVGVGLGFMGGDGEQLTQYIGCGKRS